MDIRPQYRAKLLFFPDAIYRGKYKLDKEKNREIRHGLGIMVYANGRTYEGYWRDDKRHGKGFEKFSNGDIFIGHFHKGRIQGKGKRIWKQTGEVYEGEWFQGLRHGVGSWHV
tara:strand:+ start:233 stop:571 length:339 start_codon:yes stop_codon:yes gene_type:complete